CRCDVLPLNVRRPSLGPACRNRRRRTMPTDPPAVDSSFIAITGASGLIGRALLGRRRLNGTRVRRLVRSPHPDSSGDIVWDPMRGALDPRALEGAEAVVNRAGEPIAQRWTGTRREAIRDSRVRGTELLART